MTSHIELEQLIEAVRQHPGARAFALLAERYLERGRVPEALDVCRDGFSLNPAYERGAVVYLKALRASGDMDAAARVYGRAVAEHPRSAPLRINWALMLLDHGREAEARLRAREAVELDPMSKDARALLATLGAPPPSTMRRTAPVGPRQTSTQEYGPPTHAEQSPQTGPALARADLENRQRPIGQRTTPHGLFDLTPAPVRAAREKPVSFGNDAPPLDSLVDFFDVSDEQRAAPPPEDDSAQARLSLAPPPPPGSVPPPRPIGGRSSAPPPLPSALSAGDEGVMPPSPVPARDERSRPASPVRRGAPPTPTAPLDRPARPARRRRRWVWALAGLLIVGPVLGLFAYRQIREHDETDAVTRAIAHTQSDRFSDYRAARATLDKLAEQLDDRADASSAAALVGAQLIVRFGLDDRRLRTRTSQLVKRARDGAPHHPWSTAAAALLQLDEPAKAARVLARTPRPKRDAIHRLVHLLVLERRGSIDKVLSALNGARDVTPAIAFEGGRVARLAGKRKLAERLLSTGLRASADHAGLRLERAALQLDRGKEPSPRLSALAASQTAPRLRAMLLLLRARLAHHEGQQREALDLAREVVKAEPRSLEGRWLLGAWLLAPGGDVVAAHRQLSAVGPRFETYRPAAVQWRVRALLALERPGEAAKLLAAAQELGDKPWYLPLRVRAAVALDDERLLAELCPTRGMRGRSIQLLLACGDGYLRMSQPRRAAAVWRAMPKPNEAARFMAARLSLSRADADKALARLQPLLDRGEHGSSTGSRPVDRAQLLRWRGRAELQRNRPQLAIAALREALSAAAKAISTRLDLAEALIAGGHDSEALSLLEAVIAARPTAARTLARAGEASIALGRLDKAAELVKSAPKRTAHSVPLLLLAGRIALEKKRFTAARHEFEAALAQQPAQPDALVALGRLAAARGKRRKALHSFAAALKLRPNDPKLRLQVALAYAKQGKWRRAIAAGREAISMMESRGRSATTQARIELGSALARGDRRARRIAKEMLFDASTSGSPPARAFLELGRVHARERDLARARWCFRQAIKRDHKLAAAYLELGLVLQRKRKLRRRARRYLKQYLKLEPEGRGAKRARALLSHRR